MLPLFFLPELDEASQIVVSGDEAHHAITVTRLTLGDELTLSDGHGSWVTGKIIEADKKSFTVEVSNSGKSVRTAPFLSVVQALPKSERTKESIELMVEAGADVIIPWSAARSISKWQSDSQGKWQMTSQTAAKQSRRYFIPEIATAHTTADIAARISPEVLMLVLHEEGATPISSVLPSALNSQKEICIVIGPEGGISPEELAQLSGAGAHVVKLGVPVLRSAHAAIAGLSAAQALIGRW